MNAATAPAHQFAPVICRSDAKSKGLDGVGEERQVPHKPAEADRPGQTRSCRRQVPQPDARKPGKGKRVHHQAGLQAPAGGSVVGD